MNSYELPHVTESVLSKAKRQYEPGPFRPQICNVIEDHGQKVSGLKLQWLSYAGMGDTHLSEYWVDNELEVAEALINEGRLVPTFKEDFYRVMQIQRVLHFDDVKWAKLSDGRVVIYDLAIADDFEDQLIIPEGVQLKGVETLRRRMEISASYTNIGKTFEDDPITLKDGTTITPVLTDIHAIRLRARQKGLNLNG
jgi:hypothetical protein